MFKLISKNKDLLEKLDIVDATDYKYVLTDSKSNFEDFKINILFGQDNVDEINKLVNLVMAGEELYLLVYDSNGQKKILVDQIQFIESVGDEIFVNMSSVQFTYKGRLYQIEEIVMKKNFTRISKSHIVNIKKIDLIKPAFNSKIELIMKNGSSVEVKRTYLKDFKNALGL